MNFQSKQFNILIAVALFGCVMTSAVMSGDDPGKLGPLDSITLAGENELIIENKDGHISWGEEETSRVWSIGFMETGKALSQLLKADHFKEARQELDDELSGQMEETRAGLDAISEEAKSIDPEDPNTHEIRQRWEQLYDKFQKLKKIGAEARGTLYAEQMQESYNEIIEAVNVVAERLNIDMVLRFIPPDGEFEQGNPDSTIMQIRLRTALRLPEGVDITDEVLAELGLDSQ
jgi:Skp family chaperone for outer membrane proteins